MKDRIEQLQKNFLSALAHVNTPEQLEQVRITFLARQGSLAALMGELKILSPEEKRDMGPLLQALKNEMQETYEKKQQEFGAQSQRAAQQKVTHFDVTACRPRPFSGGIHLYTRIIDDLSRIFASMGFAVVQGPEVENDFYNFTALNIPPDHPARDMQDTFWLFEKDMLLRTHTSSIQIRAMKEQGAPLALFAPGRVYRREETDATHDFVFTQGEMLLVDKGVSMANLLAIAQEFLRAIFEKEDLKIRVRPGYFPFVEPGIEIDGSCVFCKTGCSICKKTGWIELLGAGLVHPNVLRASDVDPDVYSGCALGFGIERIAMIKYGITDIRLFHSSRLDFLEQFR